MKTVSFYMSEEILEWIKKKSKKDKRSISQTLTLILEDVKKRLK